jgi:hypothetical protein
MPPEVENTNLTKKYVDEKTGIEYTNGLGNERMEFDQFLSEIDNNCDEYYQEFKKYVDKFGTKTPNFEDHIKFAIKNKWISWLEENNYLVINLTGGNCKVGDRFLFKSKEYILGCVDSDNNINFICLNDGMPLFDDCCTVNNEKSISVGELQEYFEQCGNSKFVEFICSRIIKEEKVKSKNK